MLSSKKVVHINKADLISGDLIFDPRKTEKEVDTRLEEEILKIENKGWELISFAFEEPSDLYRLVFKTSIERA